MSAMQINGSGEGTSHGQEHLEQGKKVTEDHSKLYKAALKEHWKTAQEIYNSDPNKANDKIANRGETALHIAASAGQTHSVKELVKLMNEEGLLHTAEKGDTAFHVAVTIGKIELAKAIMEKKENFEIPLVFASGESLLGRAAGLRHRKMVGLLYEANKDKMSDEYRKDLLVPLIEADMYGHEQKLTDDQKASEILQCIWKEITLKNRKSRLDDFHFKPIVLAAELGNVEFLNILVNDYPDIIFEKDENGRTIFHVAVLNRHLEIFNLIHEFGEVKNLITTYIDVDENNILHLAGMLPPSRRSGVVRGALQIRRELKWFELPLIAVINNLMFGSLLSG